MTAVGQVLPIVQIEMSRKVVLLLGLKALVVVIGVGGCGL